MAPKRKLSAIQSKLPDDSQLFSLKVPKEMLEQLHIIAKESGISAADVVRSLIEASINQAQADADRLQEDKEYWEIYEATKKRMTGGDDDWI